MRTIKGYRAGTFRWFTPKAFNNLADPTPVRISLKQPTLATKRAIEDAIGDAGELVFDGKGDARSVRLHPARMAEAHRALVLECVAASNGGAAVESYFAPGGTPILSAQDLWDHGEKEILDEVIRELKHDLSLSEDEKKSSDSPPASSEILSSRGPVESVGSPASPSGGVAG